MDEILTVKEMAQFLKMNERTVLKMAQAGAIPAAKIGGQWRFKRELVDRWLDDKMGAATGEPARETQPSAGAATSLAAMLDERLVTLDIAGSTKRDVLNQLVQLLVSSGHLELPDVFLQKLLDREQLMTTGLGGGVAFPHPREPQRDLFDRPKVVVGISTGGVDYAALDGRPVHVFFLICAPDDGTHLWTMARLSHIFRGADAVAQLLRAQSPADVVELLARWDSRVSALPGFAKETSGT
jgi:PTS system nitrogen regulatory IIA component